MTHEFIQFYSKWTVSFAFIPHSTVPLIPMLIFIKRNKLIFSVYKSFTFACTFRMQRISIIIIVKYKQLIINSMHSCDIILHIFYVCFILHILFLTHVPDFLIPKLNKKIHLEKIFGASWNEFSIWLEFSLLLIARFHYLNMKPNATHIVKNTKWLNTSILSI